MIVEFAGHERADNKVMPLESLVHRRRLVQATSYRFKIMDRKCPGVMEAIPSNKIERMGAIDIGIYQTLFFYQDFKIALFVMSFQVGRAFNVTRAIRRLFR